MPASHLNFYSMNVRQVIYDKKMWAAVIINANATTLLNTQSKMEMRPMTVWRRLEWLAVQIVVHVQFLPYD